MTPEQQVNIVGAAVLLLRAVAEDDLRECENCAMPLIAVGKDADGELRGNCPDHGRVVAWISGNAFNAREAVLGLSGYSWDTPADQRYPGAP